MHCYARPWKSKNRHGKDDEQARAIFEAGSSQMLQKELIRRKMQPPCHSICLWFEISKPNMDQSYIARFAAEFYQLWFDLSPISSHWLKSNPLSKVSFFGIVNFEQWTPKQLFNWENMSRSLGCNSQQSQIITVCTECTQLCWRGYKWVMGWCFETKQSEIQKYQIQIQIQIQTKDLTVET